MPFKVKVDRKEDVATLNRDEVRIALDERSEVLHNIFAEAGAEMDATKVKAVEAKDGADLANQVNQRNDELTWLGEREEYFTKLDAVKTQNDKRRSAPAGPDPRNFAPRDGGAGDPPAPRKSFGQLFVESELYEAAKNKVSKFNGELPGRPEQHLGMRPINAVFATTAGWAPESMRTGRVVLDEQRDIEVTSALPVFPTSQAAVVFMEETTFTNAAAERAEAAAYAEGTLTLTERTHTVRSIGVSLPVTDEQLADVAGIASYLDQRLGFMVRQRLDSQILVGDGIAPNLLGTLNVAGINTQAKGADNGPDAVYKGARAARVTGRSQPNVVFAHPNDWQAIRLEKTLDGAYLWGPPMEAGPERIWGLPVIVTTAVTENTMIVGDYARFAGLHIRAGLEVLTGFVNDDFLDGRVTIRAGLRVAVVHYRPSAFSQITGM
jgi:HK97 family phage major capsid protein